MVGYQSGEGDVDEEAQQEREAQFSSADFKSRTLSAMSSAASDNPKAACLLLAVMLLFGVHWFLAILPTLLFWLVLVPGCIVAVLYFLGIHVQLPEVVASRLPAVLGGTAGS
mmetsp:Transcript_37851/g.76562  ORF Transcript_37851/g.76562 Transcript_37851/m.76562 type:complete len:112 (-) Transcript_37851:36-371(-)|eukprot:CAMPEP_0196721662 /NCGR_PEP_ID=MMETSP1091-20130531/4167_1 /TAXON_ID=302021 /ORGANISM="Rhodomonas sp., Strain CCMP768" /LENGTH=111 /DNA_ID=CAMNT_0042063175 /DNA_START=15 /DNA_END=350 /DNA_ORIENTATION=+